MPPQFYGSTEGKQTDIYKICHTSHGQICGPKSWAGAQGLEKPNPCIPQEFPHRTGPLKSQECLPCFLHLQRHAPEPPRLFSINRESWGSLLTETHLRESLGHVSANDGFLHLQRSAPGTLQACLCKRRTYDLLSCTINGWDSEWHVLTKWSRSAVPKHILA